MIDNEDRAIVNGLVSAERGEAESSSTFGFYFVLRLVIPILGELFLPNEDTSEQLL